MSGKIKAKKLLRACAYSTRWMSDLPPFLRNHRFLRQALGVASAPLGYLNYLKRPRPEDEPAGGWMVVAIAKNEAKDIREWIDFYKLSGADRIAIFDNDSTDGTAEIIKSYRDRGVDYYKLPGTIRQLDAYNQALRIYRNRYRYMLVLDCDEFLYCDEGDPYAQIDALFRGGERSDVGGIGVNQLVYGSSGHETRPEGGVLKNYPWRREDRNKMNLLVKTVCMPTRTLAFVNPHYAVYRKGYVCLDESGREFHGPTTDFDLTAKLRINHYFTKSKEDWIEKVNRGKADLPDRRKMSTVDNYNQKEVFDDRILRAVERYAKEREAQP